MSSFGTAANLEIYVCQKPAQTGGASCELCKVEDLVSNDHDDSWMKRCGKLDLEKSMD